ncbi:MAG TPA: hypothetical protein VFN69_04395 [Rudaea sp.]|nr:hypothetical protein [Rudaea sp.]
MHLIADFRNFHRFRSVQFGLLATACGAGVAAYGAALAISPSVVSGVPHWLVTLLTVGSMVLPFASVIARAVAQPNLPPPPPKPPGANDFHQGDTP